MYLCTKENIMHHPEIAIVDPNTLTCLGLKNILEDIIPMATIRVFRLSGNFWLVSFKISYLCLPLFYETRTTPSCHSFRMCL